jgi:hypothetical protein
MKPFTFAPHTLAAEYQRKGYVHIKQGVNNEFLDFAKRQLYQCRESGRNELASREIKNRKKQYLFEMPDRTFLGELAEAIGALTNLPAAQFTLSERHIMIYDDHASSLPPLHKDRVASQVSVGIPLEASMGARVALLPDSARAANLLDNAVYCSRVTDSLALSAQAWNLEEGEYPKAVKVGSPELVELDARPGDVVVFAGSTIYHGRLNALKSAALYFKFNTMGLDPLGEDPSTPIQRQNGIKILERKSDDELLRILVQLSPRLQHISRRYTRPDWTPILQAAVSGEKDFALSDDDSWFLFALQGRRTVKDILKSLEISEDRLLSHIPRIRRLGKLGAIDFVDDALL